MPEKLTGTANPLDQLILTERIRTCGAESNRNYAAMHRSRFADVLRLCHGHLPSPHARVLDIGRSELTAHLLSFYRNVHTLGLDPSTDDGGHREISKMDAVPHITFDLLNSPARSIWPQCEPFDLIVFSEVIEHLAVAPEFVFACLGSLLAAGGVIVCTTPNAADISKRVRLALGQNPYERLRLYAGNPGHFREYTRRELCEIADSVGLKCKAQYYFNWLDGTGSPLRNGTLKLLRAYPPFRRFQVCVFTKHA